MQNVRHYTRLHKNGMTATVPASFFTLAEKAAMNDFRNGKVFTRGDATCWPVGNKVFVYVEGSRYGFLSTDSLESVSNMALNPVPANYYMTHDATQCQARLSTTEEARVVRAAASHDFSDNMVFKINTMVIVPLGYNRFTYCHPSGDFGYFFKPPAH